MSTLANQMPTQEPNLVLVKGGNTAQKSAGSSGSFTKAGINPSAAAMLILYQVMGLYSEITGINAEEQKTQISAQKEMGKAEAHATILAGKWAGWTAIAGAAAALTLTVAGAGISFVAGIKSNEHTKATKDLETDIAPIKKIDKFDVDCPAPTQADSRTSGNRGPEGSALSARAKELEAGVFKGSESDEASEASEADKADKAAIKELRLKGNLAHYQKFRDRLDTRLGNFEKARNTHATRAQAWTQTGQTIGSTVSGIGGTLNSGSQGAGQWQKAGHDANASLQRSSNSLAQAAANSQKRAADEAGRAQDGEINVLNAIRQASSNV